tara:strand:+ start:2403 stop:3365 length:963 start_codon:yes stop_codon:yes gene_type:complete
MARYFIATVTAELISQYRVEYSTTSSPTNFNGIALISPYGVNDQAENLTYFDLTDGLGLTVQVPDSVYRIRIVDQNGYCEDCSSFPLSPLSGQYNYYALTGCPASINKGRNMYLKTLEILGSGNSIVYGNSSYYRYGVITEQMWISGSGDLPSITINSPSIDLTCPTFTSYRLQNGTNSDLTFSYANTDNIFTEALLGGFQSVDICAVTGTVTIPTGISMSIRGNCSQVVSRTSFYIADSLHQTSNSACSGFPYASNIQWHDGSGLLPAEGDTVYNTETLPGVFTTGDAWVAISSHIAQNQETMRTDTNGVVTDKSLCIQ